MQSRKIDIIFYNSHPRALTQGKLTVDLDTKRYIDLREFLLDLKKAMKSKGLGNWRFMIDPEKIPTDYFEDAIDLINKVEIIELVVSQQR